MGNGFNGFPPGKQEITIIPALFFSELLPQIDHLVEMKVTLYCLWALQAQKSDYPHVRFSEVCQDQLFLQGIPARSEDREYVLRDGFERAIVRGTLLHLRIPLDNGADDFYFMNTEKGRAAVQAIKKGDWLPDGCSRNLQLEMIRPSVFAIYERAIGALTPMIAEQLQDALDSYSQEWVLEAIQVAVDKGVRKWSYILAILERKRAQQHAKPISREERLETLSDRYADLIGNLDDE